MEVEALRKMGMVGMWIRKYSYEKQKPESKDNQIHPSLCIPNSCISSWKRTEGSGRSIDPTIDTFLQKPDGCCSPPPGTSGFIEQSEERDGFIEQYGGDIYN